MHIPLLVDRRMPSGWLVNLDNVPVAPPLTGQARLEYIQSVWQAEVVGAVTEEERSNLSPFNTSTAYWDAMVRCEHSDHLHSFRTDGDDHKPPEPVSGEEEPALPPPSSCVEH